jgi:hypothetical protein
MAKLDIILIKNSFSYGKQFDITQEERENETEYRIYRRG